MRIARLDLIRYGRFAERALDFPARARDLHVVWGPNEAGKSTVKAAIEDLLFGFGHGTDYDFLYAARELRVGAVLERSEERLELRRRKGRKDTLLSPKDEPIGDAALASWLGGMDRPSFERMLGLDHERLREGGRGILEAKDDVGQVLFSAGTGLGAVRRILQALDEEAAGIYAPRAAAHRTFYVAEGKLKEAQKRLKEAAVPPRQWQRARDEAAALRGQQEELAARLRERQAARARLERIRRVMPVLADLRRIEEELQALGETPVLPADARAVLDEAERQVFAGEEQLKDLQKRHEAVRAELDGLPDDAALLEREEDIERLRDLRPVAAKARADRVRREAELSSCRQRVADKLREIGRGEASAEKVEELLPPRPRLARVRELLERKSGVERALRDARRAAAQWQEEVEGLRSEGPAEPPPDRLPLRDALREARQRGDLDAAVRREADAAARLERSLQAALDELRPVVAAPETLAEHRPPDPHAIEALRRRMDERAEQESVLAAARKRTVSELAAERRAREEILREGSAVAPEELATARTERDGGWSLVRAQLDGAPPDEVALRAFAPDGDLAAAFEAAMRRVDALSDRRFAGAQTSARLLELAERIARLEALEAEQESESERLEARAASLDAEWRALWGGPAPAPAAAGAWLEARRRALEVAAELAEQRRAVERGERDRDALRRRLLEALAGTGTDGASLDDKPLAQIIAAAEAREEALSEALRQREERARELDRARKQLAAARREEAEASQELAAWEASFREAAAEAGRDASEAPEATRAALEVLEEIRDEARQAQDLEVRIRKMDDDLRAYASLAGELSPLLASAHPDAAADAVAEALASQLQAAKERATRRRELEKQVGSLDGHRMEREEQRTAARARIDQLLQVAHCDTVERLREAIERSRRRVELDAERERTLRRLAEVSDGLPRDRLEAECAEVDPDTLPGSRESLDREIDELEKRRLDLHGEGLQAEQRLRAIGGLADAGQAAEDRQLALAEMRDEAERYVRLTAASRLLRWAVERYRKENQAPLLARAGELFRTLTGGSFEALRIDLDEKDRAYLVGVRSQGAAVKVEGMSDGSVDQLYLALRLAALEEHLDAAPALPFVADDLFVHFDDERAAAGFRALAELSRRTQVLFFTHHGHLVDVSREALGGEGVAVQRL